VAIFFFSGAIGQKITHNHESGSGGTCGKVTEQSICKKNE
jgi:hypothetical protein